MTTPAIQQGGQPQPLPASSDSATVAAWAALAAAYYYAQALIAATATRDIITIWQQLNLGDIKASWPALRTGLASLIDARTAQAVAAAQSAVAQMRAAAGVTAPLPPMPSPPPASRVLIRVTLDSTGPYTLLGRIKRGEQAAAAAENAGVRLAGSATRLISNGARQFVLHTVATDDAAIGWQRITAENPCAFCAMLASRGPVYKTQESAEAFWHDNCNCHAVPVYTRKAAEQLAANDLYRQWKQATKGYSGKQAVLAWRRYWDRGRHRDGIRITA